MCLNFSFKQTVKAGSRLILLLLFTAVKCQLAYCSYIPAKFGETKLLHLIHMVSVLSCRCCPEMLGSTSQAKLLPCATLVRSNLIPAKSLFCEALPESDGVLTPAGASLAFHRNVVRRS